MAPKYDYSEYKPSSFEEAKKQHNQVPGIHLDYYANYVRFYPEQRRVFLAVDGLPEEFYMREYREKRGDATDEDDPEEVQDRLNACKEQFHKLQQRYEIRPSELRGRGGEEEPLNNVLSGCDVFLPYGEGLLDFIYADFKTPFEKNVSILSAWDHFSEFAVRELMPDTMKIKSKEDEMLRVYDLFVPTMRSAREMLYASLYTAAFPPVFLHLEKHKDSLTAYYEYLTMLQSEYREILEFCFDEDFYPQVLGKLMPSERFALYREIHKYPSFFERTERLQLSAREMGGTEMPFGMSKEDFVKRLESSSLTPTEAHLDFAKRYGLDAEKLMPNIGWPRFIHVSYDVRTVAGMLELEFTKLLEQNIRFRKCKRCGRYFIMKGNYDTNYCDRIADGETRNCQELAAQENYKARIAGNQAIPLYNKYYKRYAARVRVRQLKEDEFKRWKYQALQKRDECSDGKITVEEFEVWLEASFPNRVKKAKP